MLFDRRKEPSDRTRSVTHDFHELQLDPTSSTNTLDDLPLCVVSHVRGCLFVRLLICSLAYGNNGGDRWTASKAPLQLFLRYDETPSRTPVYTPTRIGHASLYTLHRILYSVDDRRFAWHTGQIYSLSRIFSPLPSPSPFSFPFHVQGGILPFLTSLFHASSSSVKSTKQIGKCRLW